MLSRGKSLAKNSVADDKLTQSDNGLLLPVRPLELADLMDPRITPKGLALLLHYYHNKKKQSNMDSKLLLALGQATLVNTIQLFIKSKETCLTLLYADLKEGEMQHRKVIRLEKYNDKYYVIVVDSYFSHREVFFDFIELLKKKLPSADFAKLVLCKSLTNQQTDRISCSVFALKNISKLLTISCFAAEVDKHKIEQENQKDLMIIYYQLPPIFMGVAQSWDEVQSFIKKNTLHDLSCVRITKEGKPQSLQQYAYQPREGFGVKTPESMKNRAYVPGGEEPEEILRNRTVHYFGGKYKHVILPSLFKQLEQNTLRQIIRNSDASCLAIDPVTNQLQPQSLDSEIKEPPTKKLRHANVG